VTSTLRMYDPATRTLSAVCEGGPSQAILTIYDPPPVIAPLLEFSHAPVNGVWALETYSAFDRFYASQEGACQSGTIPVFRL